MLTEKLEIMFEEKKEVLVPEGSWVFQLLDIATEKRPTYDTRTNPAETQILEDVLHFEFAILNPDTEADHWRAFTRLVRFVPTRLYLKKNGQKNDLWKIYEAISGEQIVTSSVITADSLNALVGGQLEGVIEHVTKEEKTYANIANFSVNRNKMAVLSEAELAEIKERKEKWEASKATVSTPVGTTEIKVSDLPF